jgi:hypothetical protein
MDLHIGSTPIRCFHMSITLLSRMAVSIEKSSVFNHFKFVFTFRSILNVITPTKLRFRLSAVFKQNKNRRHFPRGIRGGIKKITKTIRLTVIISLAWVKNESVENGTLFPERWISDIVYTSNWKCETCCRSLPSFPKVDDSKKSQIFSDGIPNLR